MVKNVAGLQGSKIFKAYRFSIIKTRREEYTNLTGQRYGKHGINVNICYQVFV